MSTAATNITATWYFEGEGRSLADINGGSYGIWVGYNRVDGEMVGRIAFTLEQAAGGLSIAWRIGQGSGGSKTFNYAIVRADEDDGTLKNAKYPMTGDGTLTSKTSEWNSFSMSIERILSAGTYHMYIWTATTSASNYMGILSNNYYPITVTYDAIAGTASTLALSGGVLGQPVTMQVTRNNADFVHTLNWSFAGQSGVIAEKTADTLVTWTPDADTFGAYIPTASSGVLTVSCTTYYDAQQIGAAQTATLTLSVPADAAPVLHDDWAAVSHTNDGTAAAGLSACIAGYSKAVAAFDSSKVTAKYGAGIKTLTAAMGGSSVTGGGVIGTVSGTANTVTLTATDSRGKSSSQSVTLAAYPYSRPLLSGVTVFRCDSAGSEDNSGAFYSAKAAVTYSNAGGEIGCTLTAAVKSVGGSYGDGAALVSGAASVLGGWLSDTATYIVRIQAVDTLGGTASVEVPVPTAEVAFHIREGGDGMGLGKYGEVPGAVDSAFDLSLNGHSIRDAAYVPPILTATAEGETDELLKEAYAEMAVGTIKTIRMEQRVVDGLPKQGTWFMTLFCADADYGVISAVSDSKSGALEFRRLIFAGEWAAWTKVLTAEAVLDAVYPVGSIYIAFDHTSPAARFGGTWTRVEGAFLWGGADGSVIGQTGGEAVHTLTTSEMPGHSHPLIWNENPAVAVSLSANRPSLSTAASTVSGYRTGFSSGTVYADATLAASVGGGAAHNNMPPYIRVSIWRRTA